MYKIRNLTKYYEDKLVIDNLSLDIKKNKINSIIGRSGIGKTTLLNILSNLDNDYSGDISDFEEKKISFIFQEDRLIENLTVFENLKIVLADDKISHDIIYNSLLKCQMQEYLNYYPSKLSGGMRQRINIIRAFITEPEIMFLDEPFKSIDILLKEDIKKFFISLNKNTNNTCILVDHDIDTIIDVSDNISLLDENGFKLKKYYDNLQESDKDKIKNEIKMLI